MKHAKLLLGIFSIFGGLPFQCRFVNSELDTSSDFGDNGENGRKLVFVSSDPRDIHFYTYADSLEPEPYSEIDLGSNDSLFNSGLVPNEKVIIITHGFVSGIRLQDWGPCVPVKNAYLLAQNFRNIICVDWYKLANPTLPIELRVVDYFEVLTNLKTVGDKIAKLIEFLIESKYISGPEMVHLIGHSLGAHISGVAGKQIFKKLDRRVKRITGLDPAGPIYYPFDRIKLQKFDASFVDCIHTNIDLLGSAESVGHVDFFVNGGIGKRQPGCEDATALDIIQGDPPCSHIMAFTYYAKTVNGAKLIGCKCKKNRFDLFRSECSTPPPPGICKKPTLFGAYGHETAKGDYYITVLPEDD